MRANLEDLNSILADMAKQYPDYVVQEAKAVMHLIVNRLEGAVIQGTPAGVGGAAGLRGSIFGEVVTLGKSVTGIIGTPLEYAEVVEYGRKSGKYPPPGALLSWVEKKLGYSGKEAKQVEFLVSRKIAKKGYRGAFMFKKAWDNNEAWVNDILQTIPERVRNRINAGG